MGSMTWASLPWARLRERSQPGVTHHVVDPETDGLQLLELEAPADPGAQMSCINHISTIYIVTID